MYRTLLFLISLSSQSWSAPESWIHPFPLGQVVGSHPGIGAYLSSDLNPNSIELSIDGRSFREAAYQQPGYWAINLIDGLNSGLHLATLNARTFSGETIRKDWSFTLQSDNRPSWNSLSPSPGQISSAQPRIGLTLTTPVSKLRLMIDGKVIPTQATQKTISYQVTQPLSSGNHKVQVQIRKLDGLVLEKSWIFQVH